MKIVVIGATGTIGQRVVEKLEQMGFILTSHNLDAQDYLYNKDPKNKKSNY